MGVGGCVCEYVCTIWSGTGLFFYEQSQTECSA